MIFYTIFPAYSDVQPINNVLCALAVKLSMYLVKFRVLVKEENQGEAIVEHHQYGGIRMLKYYRKSA